MTYKRGHCFKILTVATACGLMTGFFSSCSGKTISQTQITSSSVIESSYRAINSTTSVSSEQKQKAVLTSSPTTQNASQNSSKSAKSGTLQNMYTNILNGNALTLSGLGHDGHSEHAINQQETLNKIVGMLKSSVPYNKDIPQSTLPGDCANQYTNDYIGPLYLIVMLEDEHQVKIQPYVYYTIDRSDPKAVITRRYVNNLIEVSDNGNNYYVLSQDLFDWFQNKCRVEFNAQSYFYSSTGAVS